MRGFAGLGFRAEGLGVLGLRLIGFTVYAFRIYLGLSVKPGKAILLLTCGPSCSKDEKQGEAARVAPSATTPGK